MSTTPEKKVLRLQAPDGEPYALHIYRNPPLPPPHDQDWAVSVTFDKDGNAFTDASWTISGRHSDTPDATGHYPHRRPLPNYMLGIWSDVDAPSVVIRGNDLPNSCALSVLDPITGAETSRLENDGTLKAKSVQTKDGANGVLQWGPHTMTVQGGRIMSVERAPWSERAKWIFGRWFASGE